MARNIIVVGASAGGIEALCAMARSLPPALAAPVCVVCHIGAAAASALPENLSRNGTHLARHPRNGEPPLPGQIYVAPPDSHLIVVGGALHLDRGPRENRFRPSIDPLFRSAAREYGAGVVGVLLSGALSDGVAGLLAVRNAGGVAVVQDPDDALVADLPTHALTLAGADRVVPAARLGPVLAELVAGGTRGPPAAADPFDDLTRRAEDDLAAQAEDRRGGMLTALTCPECGGNLWQSGGAGGGLFRCHVGHAYGPESLFHEKDEALEAAMWTAVRMLREKAVLAGQLARRSHDQGHEETAARYEDDARLADRQGELLRQAISPGRAAPPAPGEHV